MRRGIGLFSTEPASRMREMARLADDLGYSHAWFGDSQCLWRETYVTMAAAVEATSRMTLGTGVTNTVTRDLTVLASAWLTLHELSEGRVALGVGAGDSAVRMVGRSPRRLAEIEHDVTALRSLFAGEAIALAAGGEARMGYGVPANIPVYIAASGPKLLRLCGRIADGVILLAGTDPAFINAGIHEIERGASEAGRKVDDIDIVLWTPAAILDDGATARGLVKSHVARVAMHPLPTSVDEATQRSIDAIRDAYDYGSHMSTSADHATLVPDGLVPHFAIAGTPNECAAQIDRIAGTGVDEIAIVPYVPPGSQRESVIERFDEVMRNVTTSA